MNEHEHEHEHIIYERNKRTIDWSNSSILFESIFVYRTPKHDRSQPRMDGTNRNGTRLFEDGDVDEG